VRISSEKTSEWKKMTAQEHSTMVWKTAESETATKIPARRKTETATREERSAATHLIEVGCDAGKL
jgi:hypothetical protein